MFSDSYFLYLNDQKQYYSNLLRRYGFNYEKKEGESIYGIKKLREEVSSWLIAGLNGFLKEGEITNDLSDKLAISKLQANITFNLLANQEVYDQIGKINFFDFDETRNLYQRNYFNDLLKNATEIYRIRVSELKQSSREYFKEKGLDDSEVIFTKLDLMAPFEIQQKFKTNVKEIKETKNLTLEDLQETYKFKHDDEKIKEQEIYKKVPLLIKRKEQGETITYNQAIEEIKNLNKLANNGMLNREVINFIKSEQGKQLITYGGPITKPFIRSLNNVWETIMLFYKK